jgi:hypothetical protein
MSDLLCIPKIESSITKDFIHKTLLKLKIGYIQNIIEIPLRNNPNYKRIIIKISWNEKDTSSNNIKNMLFEQGSIKIVYDMPWYWKIVIFHPQV